MIRLTRAPHLSEAQSLEFTNGNQSIIFTAAVEHNQDLDFKTADALGEDSNPSQIPMLKISLKPRKCTLKAPSCMLLFCWLTLLNVLAQEDLAPKGPRFHGAVAKLFENFKGFSCQLEMNTIEPSDKSTIIVPGVFDFSIDKTRFELDMTKIRGSSFRPEMAVHIKELGMGEFIAITRPDQKLSYLVYPGLKAYTSMALPKDELSGKSSEYKIEATPLTEEKVDNQLCTKNRVVISDSQGKKHEATVWNSKSMKGFPIKIEHKEDGRPVTLLFRGVQLTEPDAKRFDPPVGFKKYDGIPALMQGAVMQKLGAGKLGEDR